MLRVMRRSTPILLLAAVALAGCGRGRGGDHIVPRAVSEQAAARADSIARSAVHPDAADVVVVPAGIADLKKVLRAHRGRPVLLNVWATWCGPCREEFPAMLAAAKRHPDVRLVLVSSDFTKQLPDVRRFLAEQGVRETTYVKTGRDQEFIDGLDRRWSGALPATIVYDRAGRRVAFWEGAAPAARFESALRQVTRTRAHGGRHK